MTRAQMIDALSGLAVMARKSDRHWEYVGDEANRSYADDDLARGLEALKFQLTTKMRVVFDGE